MTNASSIKLLSDDSCIILYISNIDTSILNINAKIKLILSDNTIIETTIINFNDNYIIVSKWNNFNPNLNVFIYGMEIDDAHTINIQYLGLLSIGSMQELHKKILFLKENIIKEEDINIIRENIINKYNNLINIKNDITTISDNTNLQINNDILEKINFIKQQITNIITKYNIQI